MEKKLFKVTKSSIHNNKIAMDLNKNKSQNLLRCHNVSYGKLSESEKKFSESVLVQGDRYGRKKEKKNWKET